MAARHHAPHRGDRRVRGLPVQHDGQHRRLALDGPGCRAVDAGTRTPPASLRGPRRQCAARRPAVDDQAAGDLRQLPDAAALEVPPADARPERGLLPGRVRRPHRHQGDADRIGGARSVADRRRDAGVRHDLLRHPALGAGRLRPLAGRTVRALGRTVCGVVVVFRAAARTGRQGTGRCPFADDRPDHRRLRKHCNGEAVLARAPRGRLRTRRDVRVPRHRAPPDATRHRLRDRQPHPVDLASRCSCGRRARWAWVRWPPRRRWRSG